MMGFGLLFIILIWAGIIIVAILVGKFLLDGDFSNILSGDRKKSALDILVDRYVRGEITREEFETMKKDIS